MTEFETFIATVRSSGDKKTKEITIDKKVADFMGLNIGDSVKVMIKKLENFKTADKLLKEKKEVE